MLDDARRNQKNELIFRKFTFLFVNNFVIHHILASITSSHKTTSVGHEINIYFSAVNDQRKRNQLTSRCNKIPESRLAD